LADIRVERVDGFDRTIRHLGAPAVDHDFAPARIDGGDQLRGADGVRELRRDVHVHAAFGEERGAEDHAPRSKVQDLPRACDAPNAAPDAAGQRTTDSGHQLAVAAGSLRGVEINQLHFWLTGEPLDPGVDVAGLEREPLSLDELDDAPPLKVDGWNEHASRC